jgi:hypothetical protein
VFGPNHYRITVFEADRPSFACYRAVHLAWPVSSAIGQPRIRSAGTYAVPASSSAGSGWEDVNLRAGGMGVCRP